MFLDPVAYKMLMGSEVKTAETFMARIVDESRS
jgi:hypothetical protein